MNLKAKFKHAMFLAGSLSTLLALAVQAQESDSASVKAVLDSLSAPSSSSAPSEAPAKAASVTEQFTNFPYDHNVLSPELQNEIKASGADLKGIAGALIERKKNFVLRWLNVDKIPEQGKFPDNVDDLELLCFVPEQYIDSILANGQKNIHQVGHSRGLCEKTVRAKAEDFMIGIHLEETYDPNPSSAINALRPKYGFVNFAAPSGVKMNPFRLFQYGQVIVVYRDKVKERATYTFGDSLASYCEPLETTMSPLDPIPLSLLIPPSEKEKRCRYVEAQIWGPLDRGDIQELRVPNDRVDLQKKLANCGVPVFTYDRQKIEETDSYIDVSDCGWQRGEPANQLAEELVKGRQLAGQGASH